MVDTWSFFLGQRQFSLIEKSCCYYNRKRGYIAGKLTLRTKNFIYIIILQRLYQATFLFSVAAGLFSGNDLKKIFTNNEIKINQMKKTDKLSEDGKKWLARQLIYKQKNTVSIQEQCYLRHKHLLYLSPWIYQNSRFFFLFTRTGFSLSNVVRRILKATEST